MDCFGGNIISFLRSVPALPISATPPGLYIILTFTFMHSLTIWSISGQAPPPLPISFSSSCLGLPFTSSPFTCFNLSPKPTNNMLVNSTWQDSLGAKNLQKKKLRAFGHEARSRLACDSESGAGMDAEADADSRRKVKAKADSSKHLQRHPRASVAAQCDAYSHDCISTHTGCKSVDGCRLARKCTLHICNLHIADLHASPTHSSQLTCLPVGWWLHQVTFADIAVIMVCTKFADVCIFGSFAQICSRSARIYCKPAQIAPLLLIYCKSAAICCMCVWF